MGNREWELGEPITHSQLPITLTGRQLFEGLLLGCDRILWRLLKTKSAAKVVTRLHEYPRGRVQVEIQR